MTQTYTYVATSLPHVRRETVSFHEIADRGRVGDGKLVIEDSTGTREIVGHKSFKAEQDACAVAMTFMGNVADQEYYGGEDDFLLPTQRYIEVDLVDLNARLAFKKLRAVHTANRPRETISDRITWLLGVTPLSAYAADLGFVDYPTMIIDKADYRGRTPVDVLRDMAERVGFNYFLYWDPDEEAVGLWFRDSNASTAWSSSLRISDVGSEVDSSTTFAPRGRARLKRSPANVVSGAWGKYKRGHVYRTREATEDTFEPRDGEFSAADVKTRNRARALGDEFLHHHRTQEDAVTVTIRVANEKVNLIRAGMRVEGKFTRFTPEGYGSFTWFRVLERTVTQPLDDDNTYDLALVLSPQEAGSAGPSIVQEKSVANMASTNLTLDNPVTVGNLLVAGLISREDADPTMVAGGGWTHLGSATGVANYGPSHIKQGQHLTSVRFYGKVASSSGQLMEREATSAEMWMYVWELAGASLSDITVLEADQQPDGPLALGTFENATGVALVACGFGRQSDQLGSGFSCAPGAGWTEIKDQVGIGTVEPWIYYAKATPQHDDLVATAGVSSSVGGQSVGFWGGVAILFGRSSS